MSDYKVMMTSEQLFNLAAVSVANSTQNAWIAVAREWIIQSEAEIDRLRDEVDELNNCLNLPKQGF